MPMTLLDSVPTPDIQIRNCMSAHQLEIMNNGHWRSRGLGIVGEVCV